jgi:hypothetical protein
VKESPELQLRQQRWVRPYELDRRRATRSAEADEGRNVRDQVGVVPDKLHARAPQADGDCLGARGAVGQRLGGLCEQRRRAREPHDRAGERSDERTERAVRETSRSFEPPFENASFGPCNGVEEDPP